MTTIASATPRRRTVRTVAALAVGALAAALLTVWSPGAAQAVETGTWYTVESRHSGLVLDIEEASTANGAGLVQWNRTDAQNQQFRFVDAGGGYYRIEARHSGKVIDVAESSTANGADILQWSGNGGANQQWRVQESGGYATFVNRASGKALDVWDNATTAGARISQYTPNNAANQQFRLIPVDEGGGSAEQALAVDFSRTGGQILHGATGSLYGISDDGVPGDNLIDPLHLPTMAGKPDDGEQHPNGDASEITSVLDRNGEGLAFINLQDTYSEWPYQNVGITAYHQKLREVVPQMLAEPNSDRLVFVPFNEPDQIWYDLGSNSQANFDRFLTDWTSTYRLLKQLAPNTPIAGPNEARFHTRFLPVFLERTRDDGTLPQYMTWHELSPNSLSGFRGNYAAYRGYEDALGIADIPINVNEYANNRDLSVPGQLVQWTSMFEDTKVYADMAYWTAAGGYSGSAPQTNVPNGGWWFFKTYSNMTGQTAQVTAPNPNTVDTLQGVATIDGTRRNAQVLVGGGAESFQIDLNGLTQSFWGGSVTATVHRIDWTGYEGASAPPVAIDQVTGDPANLAIEVEDPDRMAAYWVTIVPGNPNTVPEPEPWRGSWEAENAQITSGTVSRQGHAGNGNGFAASNERDVGSLVQSDSAVQFTVNVPAAGAYDLDVFYAHMYGRESTTVAPQPTQQVLSVNGSGQRFVDYPTTMNWQHRGIVTEQVQLNAGSNTIRLAKSGSIGTARGEATLDKIELSPAGADVHVYDGAFARPSGSDLIFDVYAPADGYYRITGAASAVLIGPQNQNAQVDLGAAVFLHQGVNRLRTGSDVEALTVEGDGDTSGITDIAAGQATLTGGARLEDNSFATDGEVIGWVGNGGTAAVTVDAAEAGPHMLLVHYANDERDGDHSYNIDIVARDARFSVNGTVVCTAPMRSTWSWNDFWSFPVIVDLEAGANTISIDNPDGYTANFERFEVAPVNR